MGTCAVRLRRGRGGEVAAVGDDEQTIGDASRGAEERHLEEPEEPDDAGGEGDGAPADADDALDERSPWAE